MSDHAHPVDPERVAAARARLIDAEEAARLVGLLGLLADPVRARVLYALDLVEELCVGDIALALSATEDSVGYALRVPRTAGLVSTRKEGRVVYYRLSDGFPDPLRQHCLRSLVQLSRRAPEQQHRRFGSCHAGIRGLARMSCSMHSGPIDPTRSTPWPTPPPW